MAAPRNNNSSFVGASQMSINTMNRRKICISRPKYRDGRRDRAVKVYTINLESNYLMIQGVPAIGVMTELIQLCALYGAVEEYRPLDEYPSEEFTEVYLVKFQKLTSARAAKRRMDEKSFYGGLLHMCYVPEYETVEDTRLKLQDRRRYIIRAVRNKAREKEQKEAVNEKPTSSEKGTTSETVFLYSLTDVTINNEPLIGPKLPEPPKLDMEDVSLNTTANLIRNTLKKVESVPDLKPVEKKVKPRRRI
ncbi:RNA-binding protein 48 [Dissostichus eleginoides]|uniref:RNA-binding protein 48 n=1 Tax=Dissostichus eleginoides TaxID=100907 RepID=A0AAD9EWV9_DISEL|nr:RNA-binding protein 48 [Dissostichus eleginoides]